MAETGAQYDSLLLTYTQMIGVALRAIKGRKRDLLTAIGADDRAMLSEIEQATVKIEDVLKKNPNLEMYREGYGDALRWVLTLGLHDAAANKIKKALDS